MLKKGIYPSSLIIIDILCLWKYLFNSTLRFGILIMSIHMIIPLNQHHYKKNKTKHFSLQVAH